MKHTRIPVHFALPSLLIYTAVMIVSLGQALFYSVTDKSGLRPTFRFVGLENYVRLVRDSEYLNAIKVSFLYLFIVATTVNALGLFLATTLWKATRASGTIYKTVLLVPQMVAQVCVAFLWQVIYSYGGVMDQVFKLVGISAPQFGWLGNFSTALVSVAVVDIWRRLGFHTIILYSALFSIPNELYQAADIDGAGPWWRFWRITLPLILHGLSVSLLISIAGGLVQFESIKVLTNGGPRGVTQTLSLTIIARGFNYQQQGYASAMAVGLMLMVLIVMILQNRLVSSKEVEY